MNMRGKEETIKYQKHQIDKNSFYQLYLDSKVTMNELEGYVEQFYKSDSNKQLYEFLGLPLHLYYSWVGCGCINPKEHDSYTPSSKYVDCCYM